MRLVIYKYALQFGVNNLLPIPVGAKILCVKEQYGVLTLWFEVHPETMNLAPKTNRLFIILPTGHEVDIPNGTNAVYIGTVLMAGGSLVWHVYELEQL